MYLLKPFGCCFNGHPPLGVNATVEVVESKPAPNATGFQWAPTLGGECYRRNSRNDDQRGY